MTMVHVLMAILAAWRITEYVTVDIKDWLRRRGYTHKFWTCGRCVSFWAGGLALTLFLVAPFLNWSLALSMSFLLYSVVSNQLQFGSARKITVMPDHQRVDWGTFDPPTGLAILKQAVTELEKVVPHGVSGK